MKVVVTGHHGYIGSALLPVLVEAGHEVVGLDTFFYEGCDLRHHDELHVRSLTLDVRDVMPRDLEGTDAVVHLAALSNDPLGALSPELTHEINCEGTLRVARAAREAGVSRFLFSSSCSMYGAAAEGAVDEEAPLQPLTAYAESKVRAEEGLRELAGDGFSPILMRNATAYGVSPRLRLDLVVNNLAAWAFTTGKVRILSDGTPWRPLVHVEDIAHVTLLFLQAPTELVRGEAFNVGADEENYQVRELAAMVEAAVAGCEIEYAGSGEPDARSYRVDFGKLGRMFQEFRLRWSAERGVAELVAAYAEARLDLDTFLGDRYVRLKRLERLLADGELDGELRRRGQGSGAHAVH
jgi:nucleoside-diphosphate-sugar epimerase